MATEYIEFNVTSIPNTEYDRPFIQGMLNRMGVSFHKYGKVKDAYPDAVNAIESLKARLEKYEETGNREWLIDAANFCMIEFMAPRHPEAHYRPTDSDESPGRIRGDGRWAGSAQNLDIEAS